MFEINTEEQLLTLVLIIMMALGFCYIAYCNVTEKKARGTKTIEHYKVRQQGYRQGMGDGALLLASRIKNIHRRDTGRCDMTLERITHEADNIKAQHCQVLND